MDKKPGLIEAVSDLPQTRAWLSPTERAIYTATVPGHPAHPAIVRQKVAVAETGGFTVQMLACGYSKREVLQPFMNLFPARNNALRKRVEEGRSPFDVQPTGVPNPGD